MAIMLMEVKLILLPITIIIDIIIIKLQARLGKKKLIYQRVIFLMITELKVTQMRALHIMLQIHNVFMIINNAYKPVILVPKILIIIIFSNPPAIK